MICAPLKESRNITSSNYAETNGKEAISYGYFYASVAVWFTPPLLFMLVSLTGAQWFIPNLDGIRDILHPVVFYPIKVIVAYGAAVVWVYLIIPIGDIAFGFMNLCDHEDYKNKDSNGNIPSDVHSKFPTMLLFEEFGEAGPQFAIAVIFYTNNPHLLDIWAVVNMAISCASILKGVFDGFYNCCKNALKAEARDNAE